MKNLIYLLSVCTAFSIFFSCSDEGIPLSEFEEILSFESSGELVTDQGLLNLVGQLDLDDSPVKRKVFYYPGGTSEERLIIGGDISITEKELKLLSKEGGDKHYRTRNLVTGNNRNIDILGFTGSGGQALSNRARNGLRDAVRNYNNLNNVSLNFTLTFGSSQAEIDNADMVVFDNSVNNDADDQGGVAGFPSAAGRPNKFLSIFNLQGFTRNVHEHVITHEIGHSIGFRHTDYWNRASCGQNVNEGAQDVGAIHIPRTPTRNDATSIMNACFSANSNGEFNRII